MHVEWKYKEVVGMQARGLLLTRRSERRYAEPGANNPVNVVDPDGKDYLMILDIDDDLNLKNITIQGTVVLPKDPAGKKPQRFPGAKREEPS